MVDGIDPLTLDDFSVRRPNFQADLKKIIVTGAGNFTLKNIKVDFDNPLIDILVVVPKVEAKGFYENNFNLGGWLTTRAKGRIVNYLENLKMRLTFKGHHEIRDDHTYIKFDDFKVLIKIPRIKIFLENAFADPVLNDAVNAFINRNTELFLPEVEGAIRKTFSESQMLSDELNTPHFFIDSFSTIQVVGCVPLYSECLTIILWMSCIHEI